MVKVTRHRPDLKRPSNRKPPLETPNDYVLRYALRQHKQEAYVGNNPDLFEIISQDRLKELLEKEKLYDATRKSV